RANLAGSSTAAIRRVMVTAVAMAIAIGVTVGRKRSRFAFQLLLNGFLREPKQIADFFAKLVRLPDEARLQFDLQVDARSSRAIVRLSHLAVQADVHGKWHDLLRSEMDNRQKRW